MSGHDLTFSRLLIHDSGHDDIQDDALNGVGQYNVLVTDSWLYTSRENPYQPGWGFQTGNHQPCMHPDGIQTWDGGTQSNLRCKILLSVPIWDKASTPRTRAPASNGTTSP